MKNPINLKLYSPVIILIIVSFLYLLVSLILNISLEVVSLGFSMLALVFSIITYTVNYRINSLDHFENILFEMNKMLIEHPELIKEKNDDSEKILQGLKRINGANAWNFMETVYLRGYGNSRHLQGTFRTYVHRYREIFDGDHFDPKFVKFIKKNYSKELNNEV